jgi:uncharacterized protein (TIGR02284 family)
MTLSPEAVIKVLNDLLETCYDGMDGFRMGATKVQHPEILSFCLSRAQRIDDAAAELYAAVHRLGGQPAEHGHAEATVHRGWIHFRSSTIDTTDEGLLIEMERGEEAAVHHYKHALEAALPPALHDLVADQLRGAEENLEGVRRLQSLIRGS